jgi:hypothetical protein
VGAGLGLLTTAGLSSLPHHPIALRLLASNHSALSFLRVSWAESASHHSISIPSAKLCAAGSGHGTMGAWCARSSQRTCSDHPMVSPVGADVKVTRRFKRSFQDMRQARSGCLSGACGASWLASFWALCKANSRSSSIAVGCPQRTAGCCGIEARSCVPPCFVARFWPLLAGTSGWQWSVHLEIHLPA